MRLMRSSIVMAHAHDKANGRNMALLGNGLDDDQMRAYEEYYGAVNFIHERAVPVLLEHGYGQSAQVAGDSEMTASEFHNDFQKPIGYFHSCGCMVEARDDRVYSVILGRAQRLGAWDEAEMGTLAVVQHHLSAALEIRSHLHGLEAMRHAVDTVVESLDEAVFILGRKDELVVCQRGRQGAAGTRWSGSKARRKTDDRRQAQRFALDCGAAPGARSTRIGSIDTFRCAGRITPCDYHGLGPQHAVPARSGLGGGSDRLYPRPGPSSPDHPPSATGFRTDPTRS
jgi:hypothetical protein